MIVLKLTAAAVTLLLAAPATLPDPVRDAEWHLQYLRVAEAHQITEGSSAMVTLVDTGVDGSHPDLAGSFVQGADFTEGVQNDGLTDVDGHGTALAGIIAGHGRVLGVAPQAAIQSVRVSTTGFVQVSIVDAIDWAIVHDASILCIALGQANTPNLRDAITRALQADIVVVAAAGNKPTVSAVEYPAAYPGVIAVGGLAQDGSHSLSSVSGPAIALAAPAERIMTTDALGFGKTGYGARTGTSAATAIIAGAAALVRSKYPDLSAEEVVHRLTATADDKGPPGRDHEYGYGVVNLVKALTADVPPLQPTVTSSSPNATAAASPSVDGGTTGGSRSALLIGLAVIGILIALGGYLVWRRQAQS